MENFVDYSDFICRNSRLSEEDAKEYALDCWNKGYTRYEAIRIIISKGERKSENSRNFIRSD